MLQKYEKIASPTIIWNIEQIQISPKFNPRSLSFLLVSSLTTFKNYSCLSTKNNFFTVDAYPFNKKKLSFKRLFLH